MYIAHQTESVLPPPVIRKFQRRERLPMFENLLWNIDTGIVRTLTVQEDGTIIMLGLWGAGDVVGYPLAGIEPYEIECLSDVQAYRLHANDCVTLKQIMWSHIHQSQTLQRIGHGSIHERFRQFLIWLVSKFGTRLEEGWRIPNRLTQQDIAEALGTTRVTVCRVIGELEQDGMIRWSRNSCLISHHI